MHLIDLLGASAIKLIAIATVFSGVIGFMDFRHAKAADFKQMVATTRLMRIEGYEYEIRKTEHTISRLKVSGALNAEQKLHIIQLTDIKAGLLRKLKRLNGGQ